jgi:hypothetical protein
VFRLDEASMHELVESLCAETKGLTLREDGAGGLDLVSTGSQSPHLRLEELSWH